MRRRFGADELRIDVVDRDDAHVYQPGLFLHGANDNIAGAGELLAAIAGHRAGSLARKNSKIKAPRPI